MGKVVLGDSLREVMKTGSLFTTCLCVRGSEARHRVGYEVEARELENNG